VSSALGPPTVDWYLSHLRLQAPARVSPVEMTGPAVLASLESLEYGIGFPPVADVVGSARSYVPLPEVKAPTAAPVSALVRT
jgi:hypothetical protein